MLKEIQVRPAKDLYNSAERLQEAIEHSSEDRDPGHGFEGNCYILRRITDVMYRCLKEDLIYFENCVDFTFFFKRGDTVGFVRRSIRCDLLKTCVIALRCYKKRTAPDSILDLDFNRRPVAY